MELGSTALLCPQPAIRKRKRKDLTQRAQSRRRDRGEGVGVTAAGHKRFYREWPGRGRRWRLGDCWAVDGMSRKPAARKRRLLWPLRGCQVVRRAKPRLQRSRALCRVGARYIVPLQSKKRGQPLLELPAEC